MNPLPGIHAAVTRGWNPGVRSQAISLERAIEAYTINEAYASFEEDVKRSIEEDKLADFIVLSENLFEMDSGRIGETEVVMTVVGGCWRVSETSTGWMRYLLLRPNLLFPEVDGSRVRIERDPFQWYHLFRSLGLKISSSA